ncbi:MAG: Tad domain-containing protein [Sphingomicrobium sp.]
MIGFFRRLWKDRRGNALVIAGAALPMIVGAAGLANDTIQWTLWKRQLQRAADSAALAGVYERVNSSGASTTASSAVAHDLTLNLHNWMALKTNYPQVTFPSDSGSQSDQVKVVLAIQQRLAFSSFFMSSPPTITAVATAAAISTGGNACVQALETSASATGITNSGNTTIYMPDCVMYSNSPSSNSAAAGGSSSVTAAAIATVGGVQSSNNWNVAAYRPYSPALADPFANVNPLASDMKCAGHLNNKGVWVNDALTETTNMSAARDINGNAANCWSSLSVGSNKSLTVPSGFGPIYVNGGSANLQGSFTCSSCAIVLTNKTASSPIGTINSNAQADTNITAPSSGTFSGIAIYQDRRATDCNGCNKLNGGSSSTITGAVYFPSQELWFNGGTSPTATCTMLVARRVTLTGNSKFKGLAQCVSEGLPQSSSIVMVRLVA